MSTASSLTPFTPEDLLHLEDSSRYELVDGKLVERNMGLQSSFVALKIGTKINNYLERNPIGVAFTTDASFQCFPNAPQDVRRPDVSVILKHKLPSGDLPKGHSTIPPDLAVEVLSPNDLAYDVDQKIQDYLSAGTQLIWIVNPATKSILIHRQPTDPKPRAEYIPPTGAITGDNVLPNFTVPIAEFFST